VIAHGVPRLTIDVDATVWAAEVDLDELYVRLTKHGIEGRIRDVLEFARDRQVLLLRHVSSGTPLEISLAWLPFEKAALDTAVLVDFGELKVRVARPEDLVVFKAVAWRERDRTDIERLLALYANTMDLSRVMKIVREFAEVLEDPQRPAELQRLIDRALSETE